MRILTVTVQQFIDETGLPEEFSWDLFAIVPAGETVHLDQDGLSKVGTKITAGMIIVGKVGRSSKYSQSALPTCLEIHALDFSQLKARFGHLWIDGSLYATEDTVGKVLSARLDRTETLATAIVELLVE
jgi:hypothetical protein